MGETRTALPKKPLQSAGVTRDVDEGVKRSVRAAAIQALSGIGLMSYAAPVIMLDRNFAVESADVVIFARMPLDEARKLPVIPVNHEPLCAGTRDQCLICGHSKAKHQSSGRS